ncbi:MAG: 7-cyano-7-deazaguanine synthase [Saprospiraceae bacterium]
MPGYNVKIGLPHLVHNVACHFPDRVKDLLEIAGLIYASDRNISRGNNSSLEYHSWARNFHYIIKVRDFDFWQSPIINEQLSEALCFMSGDNTYEFTFQKGGQDSGQTSLFDAEGIALEKKENTSIALFSGGMDSLAGALSVLEETEQNLILISHRSNNPGVSSYQERVFKLLNQDYPNRIQYFPFYCNLAGERAVEETQRTRVFLYTAIAFSLMSLASKQEIHVFENGITSLNFSKRQDLMNARASRTTHPKTLGLLQNFYSTVSDNHIKIRHPFLYQTKTDIFDKIKSYGKEKYIDNTVSCTKTFIKFKNNSQATHCGGCSQCVDRRFAAFASELEEYDAPYNIDLSKDAIDDKESRTHVRDYLRLYTAFASATEFNFGYDFLEELDEAIPFIEGSNNTSKIRDVFQLVKHHAGQIKKGLTRIRDLEDTLKPKVPNSLFDFIDNREYLREPVEILAGKICEMLSRTIPIACERQKPESENALNDLINALIDKERDDYEREFPVIRFSIARTIPDHSFNGHDLLIEAKYLRGKLSKAEFTNQIAADLTKYPADKFRLFVVYDPDGKISDVERFKGDFEKSPNCRVHIIK